MAGSEGHAVLTVPGIHEESPLTYDIAEFHADFVFAGTSEDSDGHGRADPCDPCSDAPEDNCGQGWGASSLRPGVRRR